MPIFQLAEAIKKIANVLITFALSFFAGWLAWKYADVYLSNLSSNNGPYELVKQIASIAGVILGFVLAAISILTAVMDKTLISNMMKTGHFKSFVKQAFYGCAWMILLIIISLGFMGVDQPYIKPAYVIIMAVMTYTTIQLIITARRFYNIIVVMSSR
jgi:hypothetical protein